MYYECYKCKFGIMTFVSNQYRNGKKVGLFKCNKCGNFAYFKKKGSKKWRRFIGKDVLNVGKCLILQILQINFVNLVSKKKC